MAKNLLVKTKTAITLIFAISIILTLFSAAGCSGNTTTKIGDILASPLNYTEKTVTISGTVGETVWLTAAEKGTYQLGDGSGTIWIITTQPPPQKGLTITTDGTVQAAFSLLGKSYGTVLHETKRH